MQQNRVAFRRRGRFPGDFPQYVERKQRDTPHFLAKGPHLDGAPGIIHGGIQGTLLDEAMCMAVYAKRGVGVVTGELTVRYRKPVPSGTPLVVRSHIREDRGRTFVIEGGIHLAESGEELTRARGLFFLSPEVTAAAREHEDNHEEGR